MYSSFDNESGRVRNVCQEFHSRGKLENTRIVQDVVRNLLSDPAIDLCRVNKGYGMDEGYHDVYSVLHSGSFFFETLKNGDLELADTVWNSVSDHLDRSSDCGEATVLTACIEDWINNLLPVDELAKPAFDQASPPQIISYRIKTPLNLFLPDSPILNKHFTEVTSRVQEPDQALRPKFIHLLCRFMIALCSTKTFPSNIKISVIRLICKHFHTFCLNGRTDPELTALKASVHVRPSFQSYLYNFLKESMDNCPSATMFSSLIDVWLTWCRPWRYLLGNCDYGCSLEPYTQFVFSNERFYTVLLGKILRRIRELNVGVEHERVLKGIFEWAWRPPMSTALELLGVDPVGKIIEVVDDFRRLRARRKEEIEELHETSLNNSWLRNALSSTSEKSQADLLRVEVMKLDDILLEAEQNLPLGTLAESVTPCTSAANFTVTNLLYTTPRSRTWRLPDHEKDPYTGIMVLTPEGRKQVLGRERWFDFHSCTATIPPILRRNNEIAWLARLLTALSFKISRLGPIQTLAAAYDDESVIGALARALLDAPRPHPSQAAPYFRETMPVWHARRTFLESHWNDLPLENLRCLSQVFINVNMIGCEYNPGVMEKIKELGAGIMDKARRLKNERAFVKASVGRKHANEIREQTEAERRPTVEQRKANRTPFEDKLIQLRAHLQIADLHSTPLQKLNTACARQQMQWQYVDKIDGAELRMNDHLICKRKFSREGFDRKEEMISTVVEAIAQAESMSVVEKELFFGEPPNVRGPYDCYEDSICRRFTRVSRHMNGKAPSMANLSEAMAYHGLAMKHDMQPTKRWEQKLVVHCGDVLLAERILKKEDCIASKTQQIIAEVAKQIIRSISAPKLVKGGDESLSLKLA